MPELKIYCFVDALGWELLQKHPFLEKELPYRRSLKSIFGYSCSCDPTILTGLLPQEHGHFSFFYYSPQTSPFGWLRPLRWLPGWLTGRGRVRHWLSRLVGRLLGYSGYFQLYSMPFEYLPLFDYSEKKDIYQSGGILSGSPTIFDRLRARRQPFYLSDWRHSERQNLDRLGREIGSRSMEFAYLYLADLDALLHRYGCQHQSVTDKLDFYATALNRILSLARNNYGDVRLTVFSDHGMTEVRELCGLRAQCEQLPLEFGRDYAAVFDSTMARFWLLNPRARDLIVPLLQTHPQGTLLTDQQLAAEGCLFEDRRYGQLFWLAHPGVLLCPSHLGEKPLKGMHGYATDHKDSYASLLSTHPLPQTTEDLRSIFELMAGFS